MVNKKVIEDAVELTKGIPAEDILVPLQTEEKDLVPYPAIEYDVLMHSNLDKLVSDVNKRLEQGWQTEGWVQVSNGGTTIFYQSMIRWNVDLDNNVNKDEQTDKD